MAPSKSHTVSFVLFLWPRTGILLPSPWLYNPAAPVSLCSQCPVGVCNRQYIAVFSLCRLKGAQQAVAVSSVSPPAPFQNVPPAVSQTPVIAATPVPTITANVPPVTAPPAAAPPPPAAPIMPVVPPTPPVVKVNGELDPFLFRRQDCWAVLYFHPLTAGCVHNFSAFGSLATVVPLGCARTRACCQVAVGSETFC